MAIRIIGLDLSTSVTGYAVTDLDGNLESIGWWTFKETNIGEKLQDLSVKLNELFIRVTIRDEHSAVVVSERPRGWHADVLIKLARLSGVLHLEANKYTNIIDLLEFGPEKGKMALTGKGNADKELMRNTFRTKYPDWRTYQGFCQPYVFTKGAGSNRLTWEDVTYDEVDAFGMCLAASKEMQSLYVRSINKAGTLRKESLNELESVFNGN